MTIDQMAASLKSVGACFAVSSYKTLLPNDGLGAKPSYHIHPDAGYPHEKTIVRVYSHEQLRDWVRTTKSARRCTDQADAYPLWIAYQDRWSQ